MLLKRPGLQSGGRGLRGGMKEFRARRARLPDIADLRELYRSEAGCQIVHDSILGRGLADPYVLEVDGEITGYAGVWNKHFPGRIMEIFTIPEYREVRPELVRALGEESGAKELEVQTNILDGRSLIERCASTVWVEKLLFGEGDEPNLERRSLLFRRRQGTDTGPEGPWIVEEKGELLGAGGLLTHYNPPYADLYMEVVNSARRRGVGSYLVQELRHVCAEQGLRPAARCDPKNHASRRTLERGGLELCGEILAGALRAEP